MKQFLIATLSLLSLVSFGANPSFTDFNANQFGTTGNKVAIKSGVLLTNPVVNSGTITGNGIGLTNLTGSSQTNFDIGNLTGAASSLTLHDNVGSAGNLSMRGDGEGVFLDASLTLTTGSFTGNGSGLTNLNPSLNAGTNGQPLVYNGTSWVSSNAASLATINGSGTLGASTTNLSLNGTLTGNGPWTNTGFFRSSGAAYFGSTVEFNNIVTANSTISRSGAWTLGSSSVTSPTFAGLSSANFTIGSSATTNLTILATNILASGSLTVTGAVFGASGSIMLTTNVSVAMAANTYTNVGNYDYTSVFGNVTAATDALTNGTAGRYYIAIHAAFTGAGGASLYEGALFTNAVECTIIEWQRDVSATYGSASASGIITLPANCRVEYKIKSPDAETASFAKLGLTMMGAN